LDGLHHVLEDMIQKPTRLLRVAVGEQFHGALEVGKQDGHLLAPSGAAFELRIRSARCVGMYER